MREHNYRVYFMASKSRVLYIGMTNNLERRVYEHQHDLIDGFSRQYRCHRLVYFESYESSTERDYARKATQALEPCQGMADRAREPDVGGLIGRVGQAHRKDRTAGPSTRQLIGSANQLTRSG